jgi:hypothetical protein
VCFLCGTNIIYIYESKVIPVTGRGGLSVYFLLGTNIIYIYESKVIPVTGRGGLSVYFLLGTNMIYIEKSRVIACNWPWRSIGVFPVWYEHHLHIRK